MSAIQQMLLLASAPGLPVLDFTSDLSAYVAQGFVFNPPSEFSRLTTYDTSGETINVPYGPDNAPPTTPPVSGMPAPTGGGYLAVWLDAYPTLTITLPGSLNATRIFCWWAANSASTNQTLRVVYDTGATVEQTRNNSLGYAVFGAAIDTAPFQWPVSVPPGVTRIVRLEFFSSGNGRLFIDDISFYP